LKPRGGIDEERQLDGLNVEVLAERKAPAAFHATGEEAARVKDTIGMNLISKRHWI
jgi:hypothetical protein